MPRFLIAVVLLAGCQTRQTVEVQAHPLRALEVLARACGGMNSDHHPWWKPLGGHRWQLTRPETASFTIELEPTGCAGTLSGAAELEALNRRLEALAATGRRCLEEIGIGMDRTPLVAESMRFRLRAVGALDVAEMHADASGGPAFRGHSWVFSSLGKTNCGPAVE